MKAVCCIPARLASKRLPSKVIKSLAGKPLIQHTYEKALKARCFDKVLVACDDPEIARTVSAFGGEAVLTSPDHPSGTSRIAEACERPGFELIVNLQADEPLIHPEMLSQLVTAMRESSADVGTLAVKKTDAETLRDPNVVKVVLDREENALYFSRAPIPFGRDRGPDYFLKHLGLYAFRHQALMAFRRMQPSPLEEIEQLEQLRFLWNGYKIRVWVTSHESFGVDTPGDFERAEAMLRNKR